MTAKNETPETEGTKSSAESEAVEKILARLEALEKAEGTHGNTEAKTASSADIASVMAIQAELIRDLAKSSVKAASEPSGVEDLKIAVATLSAQVEALAARPVGPTLPMVSRAAIERKWFR